MTPSEAILQIVADLVDLILDEPVTILAEQPEDTPRPIGFYTDVSIVSFTSFGLEEKNQANDEFSPDIVETNKGYRHCMVSIGFYRDGSMDKARKVHIGLVRQSIQDILRAAKLGLTTRSEVRDISEALEANWEKRAQFDLTLSTVDIDEDIVTAIEGVNIIGEFQTRGLRIPIISEVSI